ncbi:DNA-binding NarL/FixJ family response regulator [Xanthomonas sacchari]|uniref:response regulator n=1 Tax=unclassified Xanthomonas TaxID=2643310 RepID=UPI001369E10E|nr:MULTISPECIES: response regulator transcription factor [unclassified Xanthomonas]MBB6365568.1 DNA-binding NarL/FixJ family response regulator [Xanthomonas sp. F10]MXV32044.1 DNA-binding response regulator [Xanthomonas sp. LMG 8989]
MNVPIRVLIADDHTLVRESLVAVLDAIDGIQVVAQAADGIEALAKAEATSPDVAIVDISMPRLNGIDVVRRLCETVPLARILVLTMHEEHEYVLHAVRAGASGYLLKDSASADLIAAVRNLHAGRGHFSPQAAQALVTQMQQPQALPPDPYRGLTAREREVFHLIVEGRTTKEIARVLQISVKTAENHRFRVLNKLGMRNTAELVRYAVRHGLLD